MNLPNYYLRHCGAVMQDGFHNDIDDDQRVLLDDRLISAIKTYDERAGNYANNPLMK